MTTPVPPGATPPEPAIHITNPPSDVPTPIPTEHHNGSPLHEEKDRSERPFTELLVGSSFHGATIEFIHVATTSFIVYEANGRLSYHTKEGIPHKDLAEDAADEVMELAETELKGAYGSTLRRLMGIAMSRAFSAATAEGVAKAFGAVRRFIANNASVGRVFTRTPDYIVYVDSKGELQLEARKLSPTLLPITAEFERLKAIAKDSLPDGQDAALREILGQELAIALRSSDAAPSLEQAFGASREFVASHLGASVTNHYIIANLVASLIVGIIMCVCAVVPPTWLTNQARIFAIGALAGTIGACISVLQRASSVRITNFASHSQIISQAVVRIVLGVACGVIVVIAVKGNIAFGTFSSETHALFILAVAAGFSERLVPDLLENLAKSAADSSGAPPAAGGKK